MPVSAVPSLEPIPRVIDADPVGAQPAPVHPAPALPQAMQPPAEPDVDAFEAADAAKLRAFLASLKVTSDARYITDAMMTCLTPFRRVSGPLELQIAIMLMRITTKLEADRKKDGMARASLEEVEKGLQSQRGVAYLKNMESTLKAEQQSRLEEANRAVEGVSGILRAQNDAILASLREMRGA